MNTTDLRAAIRERMEAQAMTRVELVKRLGELPPKHRASLAMLRFYLNSHTSISADRVEGMMQVLGLEVVKRGGETKG